MVMRTPSLLESYSYFSLSCPLITFRLYPLSSYILPLTMASINLTIFVSRSFRDELYAGV